MDFQTICYRGEHQPELEVSRCHLKGRLYVPRVWRVFGPYLFVVPAMDAPAPVFINILNMMECGHQQAHHIQNNCS